MQTEILPRRELNRLHTWEAIHASAFELVTRIGLAHATVDAIAGQAGVSRRTFFNYFATKEDAVLGTKSAELTPEALEAFDSSEEDLLGRVVRLMTASIRSAFHDLGTFSKRRELLKRYPELRNRLDQHVRDAEALVQSVLAEKELGGDESMRVLLMIAGTVMRFAYLPDRNGEIDASPEAIDDAIIRFREVLKEVL